MLHQKLTSLGRTAGFRIMPALLIFGAAAAMTVSAQAVTPQFGLFNTGIDPGVMMDVDDHYTVAIESTATNTPLATPNTYVTDLTNLPYSPGDNDISKFISPQPTYAAGQIDQGGIYDFTTTFDLTGVSLDLVSIQGRFESDDAILDVLLNGHSLGILLPDPDYKGFSSYYNLATAANLLPGTNTLDFKLFNFTGAQLDPVALRTEFLTAVVPEPSVWATIVTLGSVLMAGTWLRRRRATV